MLKKFFGTHSERQLKKIEPHLQSINALEPTMKSLSDTQLQKKTLEFKDRLSHGENLNDLLDEAFAVVREAAWRTIGLRPFDVQLLGGIVLHEGKISEMKTGEGKTLVAVLPVYLNALTGDGVHVVTVNDYLAERDSLGRGTFKGMANIYQFLGLSCGVIKHGLSFEERQAAYACDIVYATNNELGFDYLRDNMSTDPRYLVQRKLNYAIVDEVDSILIDEARTPLIISGPSEESTELYYQIDKIIPDLKRGADYDLEEKTKSVFLTETGVAHVEKLIKVDNLYDHKNVHLVHHVQQGLKAHVIFKKDVDYIVKDGEVIIVDEFTGRLMPGRRYSDGLHQALEAKEHVKIAEENQTLATITFQNFFRMYKKLAGMTGTAETEAAEFAEIYNLEVIPVPTNRPMIRRDESDAVYQSEQEKFNAIVNDIAEFYNKQQPVLVGTVSIEKNEKLSTLLKKKGIKHQILNAKFHEREAEIIAQAGQLGAITIATNMAGRGTDIVLAEEVKKLGGLVVIGTERHESRRIDNQLRGRSGRQGDPGLSRFYVSLEDDLMRIFGSDRLKNLMGKLGMQEGEVISHPWVSKAIERAQKTVEGHNFDIRKHLLEYDDVMNKQREVIYNERNRVLKETNLRDHMIEVLEDIGANVLDIYAPDRVRPDDWDVPALKKWFLSVFLKDLSLNDENIYLMNRTALFEALKLEMIKNYEIKEKILTAEVLRNLERTILLQVVDNQWKDHLLNMDRLKEGIGLQAYGQNDPLIAYKKQGFLMFDEMIARVKEETVQMIFMVQSMNVSDQMFSQNRSRKIREEHPEFDMNIAAQNPVLTRAGGSSNVVPSMVYSEGGTSEESEPVKLQPIRRDSPKVGRNDLCPCGSGKKYKKCHGQSN